MKRMGVVLAVAALMVGMLADSALPAFPWPMYDAPDLGVRCYIPEDLSKGTSFRAFQVTSEAACRSQGGQTFPPDVTQG